MHCAWVCSHGLFELRCSTHCGLGAFNAVGGRCILPRQDALTMWYMTAEPCRVSVPCFRVHDLGRAEWSLSTLSWPCLWEGIDFLDPTRSSDIGCDPSLFATWPGDLRLFGPPLDLQVRAFLPFELLLVVTTNRSLFPYRRDGRERLGENYEGFMHATLEVVFFCPFERF